METNFKQVNQIWLQALQNNNLLDSAQQQAIRTMAWLCPITEGPAVYQARAIIHAYDSVYINYRNACEAYSAPVVYARGLNQEETTNEYSLINNNLEAETLYIQVYPNPTINTLNVAVLTNMPQNVNVSVYNVMGEHIETQETVTNNKAISFNLQGYAQGLYLCKITNQSGEVLETKKVLIQHD